MKRTILSTILFCITAMAVYASDSLTVRRAVYFDVDAYQLNVRARQQLDSLARSLRDQGECAVSIYGSTDIDGSAGYNQRLSERRAHTVQDYLLAHDVKAVKCVTRGLGRKGDESSKAQNRRVDVEVTYTYFSDVSDLFQSLSKDADQLFQIDPSVKNDIRCRNNTLISIPAGSLVLPNGEKPAGNVSLTVREAISTADILSQDLNSVSDGKMLETRGMVYIAANSGGQQLSVAAASPISVTIPSEGAGASDMKLFYGARHGDNTMNWKVADRPFQPDVRTAAMDIDRSMLQSMIITGMAKPTITESSDDVLIPTPPTKPRQPTVVDEPQRKYKYTGTRLERIFHKKRIERKNEELYQTASRQYEKYLERQKQYEVNLKTYEQALNVYNEQKKAFDAEGQRRMAAARQYFKSLYEYTAQGAINTMIKTVEKIPVSNKTVFNRLEYLGVMQDHPIEQHQQLRRMLGKTYFHYYHYDDPKAVIDDIDNSISIRSDSIAPVFRIQGYVGIYDSMLHASHISDTLARLQEQITACSIELGLFDQRNVEGYVASVSQLGWINCDRFYDTPREQLVNVKVKEADDVKMYMVFNDIKSCLPIYRSSSKEYISSMVPRGKKVKVIALKVIDGKPQMAVTQVNTAVGQLKLEYKTCSLADIRTNFAAL